LVSVSEDGDSLVIEVLHECSALVVHLDFLCPVVPLLVFLVIEAMSKAD
jgi:hypothetical protein